MKASPVAALLALGCMLASASAHAGVQRGGPSKPIVTRSHLIYTQGHRPILIPIKPVAAKLGTTKKRTAKVTYGERAERAKVSSIFAGAAGWAVGISYALGLSLHAIFGDGKLEPAYNITMVTAFVVSIAVKLFMGKKANEFDRKANAAGGTSPSP
ncbi:MAG: hypothetical protein IPL79_16350 [Myxococcales bacterium]|nr:hypothetical protein [Myxococcales bacterium]